MSLDFREKPQLFCCPEDGSLLPTPTASWAEGRWHWFVYPWMLFWEERDLCALIFSPWTETWSGGGKYFCVILLLYLSGCLRRFFLHLKLKSRAKKKKFTLLLTIVSRPKTAYPKNSGCKETFRNILWLPVYFIWYLVDSVSRGGCMEEKEFPVYVLL